MAISVTPTRDGPSGTAQTAALSRSLQGPPQAPFPPHCPAGNEAAAGLCAGLGGRSLPGGWGCTPHAARFCSASEGEAALGRPLRSRLPLSLGGPLPPASRWPAAGPICSRGRLPLPGTAAADGSGAEAPEAALCQGAPDWLTGLRNGYLLRVRASDWPRGTCNASSEDAGVRVPARCRGAAAAAPGMAARSRRWPQHPPAPGALGPSGQYQQRSRRNICRLLVPLQLAPIAAALLMSQSWQEEAVPQPVTSSEQGFYVKKRQKTKPLFSILFYNTGCQRCKVWQNKRAQAALALPVREASLRPLLPVTA
ncbi:uncharacterized protein LOC141729332 [Zonotrichia albicollis]|uniref:uncharacterized protein LOC141729332 n=1 Tax=Zonotrichia albicollis TaxID=44394 RepID=UPI003D80CD28